MLRVLCLIFCYCKYQTYFFILNSLHAHFTIFSYYYFFDKKQAKIRNEIKSLVKFFTLFAKVCKYIQTVSLQMKLGPSLEIRILIYIFWRVADESCSRNTTLNVSIIIIMLIDLDVLLFCLNILHE